MEEGAFSQLGVCCNVLSPCTQLGRLTLFLQACPSAIPGSPLIMHKDCVHICWVSYSASGKHRKGNDSKEEGKTTGTSVTTRVSFQIPNNALDSFQRQKIPNGNPYTRSKLQIEYASSFPNASNEMGILLMGGNGD